MSNVDEEEDIGPASIWTENLSESFIHLDKLSIGVALPSLHVFTQIAGWTLLLRSIKIETQKGRH
jgi:hypothetical protein